ncbi:hypothetical protein PG994_001393 [Apiospora phragmitis]|uniref:Cytochrome P450 n=1 Tax=Apiospora phragmitis TaxID=2905665 RepID=A0ABR1WTE6_9PEZI
MSKLVAELAGAQLIVVLGAVSLLLYFMYERRKSKPKTSLITDIAILNARKGELFSYIRATWRNTLDLRSALELHRLQYAGQTVRVPIVGPGKLVLLPAREAKWLIDQPESVLSMHQQTDLHFQTAHKTVYPLRNQAHVHLVMTKLTRQVGNLVPVLMEEIELAMPQAWNGTKSDEEGWQEVDVFDTLRVVIGQVTNRIFIGAPLCRSRELLDAGVAYAQAIPVAAQIISLFPASLRWLVAPLITIPNRAYEKTWFRLTLPEVEAHLRGYGGKEGQEKADFLQWSLQQAKETGDEYMWEPKTLAARVLLVNAAAVHTSSFAITHVLLDLVGSGTKRGSVYVSELRDEIRQVLAAHGGWSKRALDDMHKLDSAFRESQRLNTVLTVGPLRIVNAGEGVTTPSGVHIPKGYQVGIPAYQMHMDSSIWGEDVAEFRPFRFLMNTGKQDTIDVNDTSRLKQARQPWVTTSQEYLSFGGGRNSCPGRFFAAAELKLLLAHILLNYDFDFQKKRPSNQWFGTNHLPQRRRPSKSNRERQKQRLAYSRDVDTSFIQLFLSLYS